MRRACLLVSCTPCRLDVVFSLQMYGRHRVSRDVRQRHLADSLDTLLEVYSSLKVSVELDE